MGAHNVQTKKGRQQRVKFLIKTATATITRAELLADVTIQANKASAITLTLPPSDESLSGVFGGIGNKGAGVLTVSYTGPSGVTTRTVQQDEEIQYKYDEDGKCYLAAYTNATTIGLNDVTADPGDAGALAIAGSVAMTSAGASETRTLAIPDAVGDMLSLTHTVDGGDITVTVASAYNVAGNTTLAFTNAGDNVVLVGATVGAAVAWRIVSINNVGLGVADPGDGAALPIEGSVAMTSGAGGETRTLAAPAAEGDMLSLTMDVDGSDIVVTSTPAINVAGNKIMTFDNAGENIILIGAQVASALVWRVVANDGVGLST